MNSGVTFDERPRLRRAQQGDAAARRQARDELAGLARVLEQRLHVVEEGLGDVDVLDLLLQAQQRVG